MKSVYIKIFRIFVLFLMIGVASSYAVSDYYKLNLSMTGYSTPSPYVVAENSHYGVWYGWQLFDGDTSTTTGWQDAGGVGDWVYLDLGSSNHTALTNYTIHTYNSANYQPTGWTVYGSNTTTFTDVLDTQTGQSLGSDTETTYDISTPKRYRYYKFQVDAISGGGYVIINELQYYKAIGGFPPDYTIYSNLSNNYTETSFDVNLYSQNDTNMSYVIDDSDLIMQTGLQLYYQAEYNFTDRTSNNNDATNNGAGFTSSINASYGLAFDLDGASYTATSNFGITNDVTQCAWVNPDSTATQGILSKVYGSTSGNRNGKIGIDVGKYIFYLRNTIGTEWTLTSTTSVAVDSWAYVCGVVNGTGAYLYINGTLEDSDTLSGTLITGSSNFEIGAKDSGSGTPDYFNGQVDEVRVYNIPLSPANITTLYETTPYYYGCDVCNSSNVTFTASGSGEHDVRFISTYTSGVTYSYDTFNLTFATPEITHNITSYYNTTSISIQLNTSSNVNMSYYLDGGSKTSICNNCNNSVLNLSGLSETNHSIVLSSTDAADTKNVTTWFIVDTTSPGVSDTFPGEITLTYINVSNYVGCSDTYLTYCNVTFFNDSNTVTSNSTKYNFTYYLNQSYTIKASDLAGNTVFYSGYILVNPYQYFYAWDNFNMSYTTNFTINGNSSNGTVVALKLYDIGLGDKNITFAKLSYADQTVQINFNTTSLVNYTFNVSSAVIVLSIYDRETGDLVTGLSTITLVATYGFNGTTTTGTKNISDINFFNESYQLIVSHANYSTETVYFDYDNRNILNVNVYLLSNTSSDAGVITIQALSDTGYRVENSICSALEWKPDLSAYQSVAEGLTNINGETTLNIEIGTKLYKFSCIKSGNSAFSSPAIISESGQTLPIILVSSITQPDNLLGGISGTFTNSSYNSSHDRLTFTFADSKSLVDRACIYVYRVSWDAMNVIDSTCLESDTGQIQIIVKTNNSYKVVAQAKVLIGTQEYQIDESIVYLSYESLGLSLKDYHLDIFLPLIFVLIGIAFGFILSPQNIYISLVSVIVMVWLSVSIVPSIISSTLAIFITAIAGFMLWAGARPK